MKQYLIDILPSKVFWPDPETKVDLSKEEDWSLVRDSISEYVRRIHTPLIKEHTPDGGSYGQVLEVFEQDGKLKGVINITDPDILLEIEKNPNRYRYVSPRISWNYKDVAGMNWPAALLELSLVSVPRSSGEEYQDQMQEIDAFLGLNTVENGRAFNSFMSAIKSFLWNDKKEDKFSGSAIEIALSEKLGTSVYETSLEEYGDTFMLTPEIKDELQKMFKDMLIAHMEEMNAEKAEDEAEEREEEKEELGTEEMAESTEVPLEGEPQEDSMGYSKDDMMSELEDMKAAYATLKAEYESLKNSMQKDKEDSVMSAVKADMASRNLTSDKLSGFVTLYKTDKAAYESAMSAIPVQRKVKSEAVVGAPKSPVERAKEIQAQKGGTFANALKAAYRELG